MYYSQNDTPMIGVIAVLMRTKSRQLSALRLTFGQSVAHYFLQVAEWLQVAMCEGASVVKIRLFL